MHPRRKGYRSLDELYSERDGVAWYWRVAALAASWLILGGYLILPTTFDSDPNLRFSQGGLDALIAVLLTCGYTLTLALYFIVPSWLYQAESLFYPALCASAFGLISVLYAFASSPRYHFTTAAGITIALTSSSTATTAILLVWTQRKIAAVRTGTSPTTYHADTHTTLSIPDDGRASQASAAPLYQEPNYYRNYIANMHPSAIRAASPRPSTTALLHTHHPHTSLHSLPDPVPSAAPSPSSPSSSPYDPPPPGPVPADQIADDEQVSRRLARLLLNTRDAQSSPAASQATFRIDWRAADEDDASSPRVDVERGRAVGDAGGAGGHRRGKSRDDRRREIELGFVGGGAGAGAGAGGARYA